MNTIKIATVLSALLAMAACQPEATSQATAKAQAKEPTEVGFNALSDATGCSMEQLANGAKATCGERFAIVSNGAAGAKGDTGSAGMVGASGANGSNGAQGAQGVKGDKGDTGAAGVGGVVIRDAQSNVIASVIAANSSTITVAFGGKYFATVNAATGIVTDSHTVMFESGDCSGQGYVSASFVAKNFVIRGDNGRHFASTGVIMSGLAGAHEPHSKVNYATGACVPWVDAWSAADRTFVLVDAVTAPDFAAVAPLELSAN